MAGLRRIQGSLMASTALLLVSVAASILLWSGLDLVRPGHAAISSSPSQRTKNNRVAADLHGRDYGPGFYNHSGCLYAHLGEGGHFEMTTADEFRVNETLDWDRLDFEAAKSRCPSLTQSGKLTFSYKFPKNKRIGSIVVTMRILPTDNEGYWEVGQANLTVNRADTERKRTFALRLPGIYAGSAYSYSCSELLMSTLPKRRNLDNETKTDPMATIVLPRFQLQPFGELKSSVFAASYDCSSWLTIPGLMGLILIVFMMMVTVIGVLLLKGIETNDFKFNKEGLQFTQAQMETNKMR